MNKWTSYLMSMPYISFDNLNTIGQKKIYIYWWSHRMNRQTWCDQKIIHMISYSKEDKKWKVQLLFPHNKYIDIENLNIHTMQDYFMTSRDQTIWSLKKCWIFM